MFDYQILPGINAILNSIAAILLVLGFLQVKKGNVRAHYKFMWAAFFMSLLFLSSYLTYHTLRQMHQGVGHTVFVLEGAIRYFYYTLLFTHLIGAFAIAPIVPMTLWRGKKAVENNDPALILKHRKIAKWTFPLWLYVSVTGVFVYLMLYQLPGATG